MNHKQLHFSHFFYGISLSFGDIKHFLLSKGLTLLVAF
jgi:hypothetical protein